MYIVIRRRSDLGKLKKIKDIDYIVARFMMNGCYWCEKSQPDWNKMTTTMSPQLDNHQAIVEVESRFVDMFRKIMERQRKTFPPVDAYPSVYVMSSGVASPHQGRDYRSLVQLVQDHEHQSPRPLTLKKVKMDVPKSRSRSVKRDKHTKKVKRE